MISKVHRQINSSLTHVNVNRKFIGNDSGYQKKSALCVYVYVCV